MFFKQPFYYGLLVNIQLKMDAIIAYFDSISSLHRGLILAGGIAIFWLMESAIPLFRFRYKKWGHAAINIVFTLTTVLVNFVMAFLLVMSSVWVMKKEIGLLNWLPEMPLIIYTFLGLMILDFIGAYLVHFVQHKVKWMWKFHLVHHTDTYIDTTSANRHHPGESVIRFVFTVLAVIVAGAPMWLVFLYQSLSVVFSQFNHANISLPRWLDKAISYVFVSPDMHKVHHHYQQPYTDTNYGNIFSLWDRWFGTFAEKDVEQLVYGVDTHMDKAENDDLANLFKIPFQPYREPIDGEKIEK